MDSLINAAARALAAGDPLGALNRVALRDDAPALALRGIAMAQLGDLGRAKALLRRAGRAFGAREAVARARCVVAEAEIAFAARDLSWPAKVLDAARATLERHGDRVNAAHARQIAVRRFLLIGRLDEAERALAELDAAPLPPAARTVHELVVAGIAMRRLRTEAARAALARAERAARRAGIAALTAEVDGDELLPLHRQAALNPTTFKALFETFHGDTVSKARLKQRLADLKVHPDETATCADLYVETMLVSHLVTVDGEQVAHLNASEGLAPESRTQEDPGSSAVEEQASHDQDSDAFPQRPESSTQKAIFNVNVTLDSSLDTEKLEKHLRLLKRYGAI